MSKPGRKLIQHGMSGTSEHRSWMSMLERCYGTNPTNGQFYKGRGIQVCARWRESFPNFLADMGPKPTPKHTIDRINSDLNYEPENCRWATRAEQVRNTSRNHWISYGGERLVLEDWALRIGIDPASLLLRLRKWTLEMALTTPPVANKVRDRRRRTQ